MVYRDGESILGMGCMRFPIDSQTGDVDYELTEKMVDYAYEHGVNYYDTAYPYHDGKSQIIIGNILKKYPRESFHLVTKLPIWKLTCKEDVREIFEEQLRDCQVEYFDYYLCHAVSEERFEEMKKFDVYAELSALKAEGKIRHLGFSFHDTPAVLEKIVDTYEWDFAQIQLNYWDWEAYHSKEQYEILESRGIPAMIMEPVRGGALANLSEEANAVLKEAEPESSVASWAIRYAMSLPGVRVVLSGMSNMEQIVDNVKTAENFAPLTDKQQACIQKALAVFKEKNFIPCTGCRYCMECPFGVDIPAVFKAYNNYSLRKRKEEFEKSWNELKEKNADPSHCMACGNCKSQCPQSLDIPELLRKVSTLAAQILE